MDLEQFFNETVYDEVPYRRPKNFNYSVLRPLLGGYGPIYHGTIILEGNGIPNEIAVKRLSTSASGAVQLSAVMKSVGQMHHRNVERLLGWCDEQDKLLLVYNYMPNGSLSEHLDRLDKRPVLRWTRRLKILCGITRALAYLHEGWEQRVIHRDVKPSNIMLDEDFNAHLSNFDLALFCEHDRVQPSSDGLRGTHTYMDPHYIRTSKPTEKSDVYSFGITVLELATGRAPDSAHSNFVLVDWVRYLYRHDALSRAADPTVGNVYDRGEMILLLKMGLLCCNPQPYERPDMTDVVNICKGSIPFPPLPSSIFHESSNEAYYDNFDENKKYSPKLTVEKNYSQSGILGAPIHHIVREKKWARQPA